MLNNDSVQSIQFAESPSIDVLDVSFQPSSSFQGSSYIHEETFQPSITRNKSYAESEFLHSIISSPSRQPAPVSPKHPEYLSGYTGQLRSMRESYEEDSVTIIPTLGYSGAYKGKVEGKLGKSNVHRSPISRREIHHRPQSSHDETFEYSHSRDGNYHNCEMESMSRGQTAESIMKGIEAKIHFKYPRTYVKITSLKNLFEKYDPCHTGSITFDDFQVCCVYLNIVLPRVEFTTLAASFDETASGAIQYRRFINRLCGAYTEQEVLAAEI